MRGVKMKNLILFMIVSLSISTHIFAQKIIIHAQTGTNEYNLADIDSITFSVGTLGELVWEEDFESYTAGSFPSAWTPDANATDNSTNYVDNTVSYEGTKSLRLFGSIGGCWGALTYHPLNVFPPYEIEVVVRNGNDPLSGCHPERADIHIRQGTSWTNPSRGFVLFKGDGTIVASGTPLGTYTTETWYTVKVRYERPSSSEVKLSYWINGIYKGSETFAPIDAEDQITNFELTVQEGTAWFDAVRVYQLSQ